MDCQSKVALKVLFKEQQTQVKILRDCSPEEGNKSSWSYFSSPHHIQDRNFSEAFFL